MTKTKSLLPNGISDVLSPNAEKVESLGRSLLDNFTVFGYEMVSPPLMEFEESITSEKLKNNSFRVLDPQTNKMMVVRSDITMQIGRIATHRLQSQTRPLRIMYAGNVLRIKGTTARPARGFKQYGVELIGIDSPNADAEVISLAVDSLQKINVSGISVDICMPKLPEIACDYLGIDFNDIQEIIEKRDMAKIKKFEDKVSEVFTVLLQAQGNADKVIPQLKALSLNDKASQIINRVAEVVEILSGTLDAKITIDACETKGFNFQTGIGFTLFSNKSSNELGRGGRYELEGSNEPSVGFSMYSDTLENIVGDNSDKQKIFAPLGTDMETINSIRGEGKIVIMAISKNEDGKKLGCTHIIKNNKTEKL